MADLLDRCDHYSTANYKCQIAVWRLKWVVFVLFFWLVLGMILAKYIIYIINNKKEKKKRNNGKIGGE